MRKDQCECAYCSRTIPRNDVYVYKDKIYHSECGERVRLRTENPGSFRQLDEFREMVETLYDNEKLVVRNIDEIELMKRQLCRLIKSPN